MGPDCRLERLEPTSVIAVRRRSLALSHTDEPGPNLDHRHHRIKEGIGTTGKQVFFGGTRLPGYRLEPIVSLCEGFAKGFAKGFANRFAKGSAKRSEVCKGFAKGSA